MPETNKHIFNIPEWPKNETSYELAGKLLTSQRQHADSVLEVIKEALSTANDENIEHWRFALTLCENQKAYLTQLAATVKAKWVEIHNDAVWPYE